MVDSDTEAAYMERRCRQDNYKIIDLDAKTFEEFHRFVRSELPVRCGYHLDYIDDACSGGEEQMYALCRPDAPEIAMLVRPESKKIGNLTTVRQISFLFPEEETILPEREGPLYAQIYRRLGISPEQLPDYLLIQVKDDEIKSSNELLLEFQLLDHAAHTGEYVALHTTDDDTPLTFYSGKDTVDQFQAKLQREFPDTYHLFAVRKIDEWEIRELKEALSRPLDPRFAGLFG